MSAFRWTLNNTVSGTLVLTNDPIGWDDTDLVLERNLTFHGVFEEWISDLLFHCDGGGKQYLDNILDTQGVDALVTLLVEYDCDDSGTFETLFDGKLNLSKYIIEFKDSSDFTSQIKIVRNDIVQTVLDRQDMKVNLNELFSIDGTALTAYTNAPASINVGSQQIDLVSEIDGASFTDSNLFDGVVRPQFVTAVSDDLLFQSPLPINEDDLKEISASPDFHNKAQRAALISLREQISIIYDSENNGIIRFPETYNVSWNFVGTYTDTVLTPPFTNRILSVGLNLVLSVGPTISSSTGTIIGTIPGYNSAVNPLSIPFAFIGGTSVTLNRGDKIWLYWLTDTATGTGYVIVGGATESIQFDFFYTTSELILEVNSTITPGSDPGFAIYETWARVSESITDQVSFAFRSDFYGRTDSEPNLGGAPTYLADGCGSLNFMFSGLALRGYGKHKLESPLPDFTSLREIFDSCESVHNIGMGVETFGGQTVLRVEELDFFYDPVSTIQLSGVQGFTRTVDTSFMYNEFDIGFAEWEPENFNGLDEINTKHEYNTPISSIKNKLSKLSPWLASGYAIEDVKRTIFTQGRDHKYDNNNFWLAVRRVLLTFGVDNDQDFTATAALDNPGSRRNLKITPKRNFLRWLNVIGTGLTNTVGLTIDFREGDANVYYTTTQAANGCNGDYTGNLLDADGDIAWDDANARLNSPIWDAEVYEFDAPLSFTQYKVIRDAPRGFIEFRVGNTGAFRSGFILELRYPLQGGLTHFKLLRRHT